MLNDKREVLGEFLGEVLKIKNGNFTGKNPEVVILKMPKCFILTSRNKIF